jgi:hypothetical protein
MMILFVVNVQIQIVTKDCFWRHVRCFVYNKIIVFVGWGSGGGNNLNQRFASEEDDY